MIPLNTQSGRFFYSTVRIKAYNKDGKGQFGTAFFFEYKVDDNRSLPVLVTNKHVVEGFEFGEFYIHEAQDDEYLPKGSAFGVVVTEFNKHWINHPGGLDLCVMPIAALKNATLAQGKKFFYANVGEESIPTQEMLDRLAGLEEIVMVGYPIGLWDEVNNFPLLRRGITASHPSINFFGEPVGVVDVATFPGSSGSPIFVSNEGFYSHSGGLSVGNRFIFLGILYAHPNFTADGSIEVVEIPTTTTNKISTVIPPHLGYYIKSTELLAMREHLFSVSKVSGDLESEKQLNREEGEKSAAEEIIL